MREQPQPMFELQSRERRACFSFNAANTSSLGCSAHLGHGSRQGEKRLLLQEGLIHGGHVGLHMELIGFALCSLRLAQPEVVVRRPVVGDAEAHEKNEKTHDIEAHRRFKCNVTRKNNRIIAPHRPKTTQSHETMPHATTSRPKRYRCRKQRRLHQGLHPSGQHQ